MKWSSVLNSVCSILLFCAGCVQDAGTGPSITFENRSNSTVSFYYSLNASNTVVTEFFNSGCTQLSPDDSCVAAFAHRQSWTKALESSNTGYIVFLSLDSTLLADRGLNYVLEHNKILKEYIWNHDSLENHHWRISYP
jgi:hypothetical protein